FSEKAVKNRLSNSEWIQVIYQDIFKKFSEFLWIRFHSNNFIDFVTMLHTNTQIFYLLFDIDTLKQTQKNKGQDYSHHNIFHLKGHSFIEIIVTCLLCSQDITCLFYLQNKVVQEEKGFNTILHIKHGMPEDL
ncbi:hypothetical protein ACJX0J_030904, partial [Zea mays]